MTNEEGSKLLNSGNRKFGKEAEKLVEALGGLPLALELSKNFMNLRPALSIDDLLQEIGGKGEISALKIFAEKYADELPSGHVKEVAATFQLSWDAASSTAKNVLQCMSLLAPTPVPMNLIRKILNIPSDNRLEDPLHEAIRELVYELALLDLDEDNDPRMHRLISAFIRGTIGENDELFENVVNNVEKEMSRAKDESDLQAYQQLEKIAPHAEFILSFKNINIEQNI